MSNETCLRVFDSFIQNGDRMREPTFNGLEDFWSKQIQNV